MVLEQFTQKSSHANHFCTAQAAELVWSNVELEI